MEKTAVKQFTAGNCYSYILSNNGEAAVIDPHISLKNEYLGYLSSKTLKLLYVIDTHMHADHFSLAAILRKQNSAQYIMHENAVSSICDRRFADEAEFALGSGIFNIIYTPGHTDDSICIYGENMIFTGDLLLIGSVGRSDFQNGSPESMFDSLFRIKQLPGHTILYPGHDYNNRKHSILETELRSNPFLMEQNRLVFIDIMRSKILPKPFNMDNIIKVNKSGEAAEIEVISPKCAETIMSENKNARLLDVRTPLEYSAVHIKDSVNIPLDTLPVKLEELDRENSLYIVLCRTGDRSPMAAQMLRQAGIIGVKIMEGGITAWQKSKLPVEKGAGGISIERQVRLIAGFIILISLILAIFVNWLFTIAAIFMACGLIFAGITDSCLMGTLLMKLPYNKKLYQAKPGGTCSI